MSDVCTPAQAAELRTIAKSLRDLVAQYRHDKESAERLAGVNLQTAIGLGAFAGAEHAELRHLISLRVTEIVDGHQKDQSRSDALGTPVYRAIDWLMRKKKLPEWMGGSSDLWFPDGFIALADLIGEEATLFKYGGGNTKKDGLVNDIVQNVHALVVNGENWFIGPDGPRWDRVEASVATAAGNTSLTIDEKCIELEKRSDAEKVRGLAGLLEKLQKLIADREYVSTDVEISNACLDHVKGRYGLWTPDHATKVASEQSWWLETISEYLSWRACTAILNFSVRNFGAAAVREAAKLSPPMDPGRLTAFLAHWHSQYLPDAGIFSKELAIRRDAHETVETSKPPAQATSQAPAQLSGTKWSLHSAARKAGSPLIGEELAALAGVPFNSHTKACLAQLVELQRLSNGNDGYRFNR